jgi:LysM repeat protein
MAAVPLVCPFVALEGDRDRRADGPDPRNRCYAESRPLARELAYQTEYCYSRRFSSCSVFLAWAARNAAEPTYVPEAAARAWGSGIAVPEPPGPTGPDRAGGAPRSPGGQPLAGHPASPAASSDESSGATTARSPGQDSFDWVSASAWAGVPALDEELPEDVEEPAAVEPDAEGAHAEDEPAHVRGEEPVTGPKVPPALPMRRRRSFAPIRTRGSGEWYYADPPDRQPLVRRRFALGPPVALGVLGLLVVALVVFVLPMLLPGGPGSTAVLPTGSPEPSRRPFPTSTLRVLRTPAADVSAQPSSSPESSPAIRTYRVRPGDVLSAIAARFDVTVEKLQCMNYIRNPNVLSVGQRLQIPPPDYVCPPNWRRATPLPETTPSPAVSPAPGATPAPGEP